MAYKTIMVYLDNEVQSPGLLKVATDMARRHSAHLLGIYAQPPLQIYVSADVTVPVYMFNDHEELHKKIAAKLETQFGAATENEDFVSEWRYIENGTASVADVVIELARTSDLVVLGQKNIEQQNPEQREVPEQVLLNANRPVVLVPSEGDFATVGKSVFVAWEGGAAATRAVFDALPALQLAETVVVHRINPGYKDRHKLLGAPAELVKTLARHNVNAQLSESDARSGEIGEELLAYAREQGADLMVMGAYGHSKFREIVFGGVSRSILDKMPVPVLMSH